MHHAASGIAWGRFSNAGQTCVAPKRIYVEAPAYESFVAALAEAVNALTVGAGDMQATDVGPMIRAEAVAALEAQRDDAISRGATVVATAATPAGTGGSYFAPTVLAEVPAGARVLREETFGPLLPVSACPGRRMRRRARERQRIRAFGEHLERRHRARGASRAWHRRGERGDQ